MDAGMRAMVEPSDQNSEATRDPGTWMVRQPLVPEDAGAEMVALHDLSSTPPTSPPLSRPVVPLPAGLSSKEIARVRREGLSSQAPHDLSTLNLSTSSASAVNGPSGTTSSYDSQRIYSEFESIRREMEQLRTEVVVEAPPSYTSGDK
jgi:hypothetical protein